MQPLAGSGARPADTPAHAGDGATPKLAARAIHLHYGDLHVLDDVNLEVQAGEFVAIVGPSGCGKSSWLRLMAGLEQPSAGELLVDGQPVMGPDPRRTLIFQEHALYPWRTVWQNIAFGLELQGRPKPERRRQALSVMERVGLAGFADYYPHQLSGGMRQRVAIARALVMDPDILLMDEPYGALDAITRLQMQQELTRLWNESQSTVVLITHDIEEALFLADRVVVMAVRPSRVIAEIHVPVARPRHREDKRLVQLRAEIFDMLGLGGV